MRGCIGKSESIGSPNDANIMLTGGGRTMTYLTTVSKPERQDGYSRMAIPSILRTIPLALTEQSNPRSTCFVLPGMYLNPNIRVPISASFSNMLSGLDPPDPVILRFRPDRLATIKPQPCNHFQSRTNGPSFFTFRNLRSLPTKV
jgi:hypothetical protein